MPETIKEISYSLNTKEEKERKEGKGEEDESKGEEETREKGGGGKRSFFCLGQNIITSHGQKLTISPFFPITHPTDHLPSLFSNKELVTSLLCFLFG